MVINTNQPVVYFGNFFVKYVYIKYVSNKLNEILRVERNGYFIFSFFRR